MEFEGVWLTQNTQHSANHLTDIDKTTHDYNENNTKTHTATRQENYQHAHKLNQANETKLCSECLSILQARI